MGFSLETIVYKILLPGLGQTVVMVTFGFLFSAILGFALALVLITTSPQGLKPHPVVYHVVDVVVNIIRSTPFIIFMIAIMPLSRALFGTVIGTAPAVFALSISASSLVARLLEGAFREVDPGLIEAARSFGAPTWRITWNVIVGESVPSLVSNYTLACIQVLSGSAMAGVIGAGGLGAIALTYGYQNFNDFIMYTTVIILIVITQIIQLAGNRIYAKIK